MLTEPDKYILRDGGELELANDHDDRITPYWDPKLRFSRQEQKRFFSRLHSLQLVGYRRSIRGRVGMFFVLKKDGSLKMIIDGRESSRLCKKPPHSWLGTVSALSQLDLSDSAVAYANGG
eukprot:10997002-Karenia_brevis.AAC.1